MSRRTIGEMANVATNLMMVLGAVLVTRGQAELGIALAAAGLTLGAVIRVAIARMTRREMFARMDTRRTGELPS